MCSRKWLIGALVVCGMASACSDYNTNLSIQTSSSVLTFVSPSSATVGGQGFTITANGAGFVTGALILWNGAPLTTTLVSSSQLTAPVPASDLATAGTVQIAVQIPGSAASPTSNVYNTTTTEVSNVVLFTIAAAPPPAPTVSSLSASTTSAASTPSCSTQGFTLTVNGANFTSDATVNWNGTAQTTTFVSATQLTAPISASQAAFAGTAAVTVTNSGGTSSSLPFTLSTPTTTLAAPSLTSLSQTSAAAGSASFILTVGGANILPCSVVQWSNQANVKSTLATTFVSATQLTSTVPAAELAAIGTAQVAVVNQGPGNASSSPISFTIVPPTVASVAASTTASASTPSCSPASVSITVTGANFVNGSVVQWVTQPPPALPSTLATTFVNSTQLTAIIPASYTASAAQVNIQVSNFGVLSTGFPFSSAAVLLPAPTTASISPSSATAGASGATITVTGTNLLPCSVVQWTAGSITTQLATTYGPATQSAPAQLTAAVPAANIAAVGTAQVTVFNPPLPPSQCTPGPGVNCGGGTSSADPFSIILPTVTSLSASTTGLNNTPFCGPGDLTLTVNGTGFAQGLTVNWNGSPRATKFVSAAQLTAAITPADTAYLATGAAAVAITVSGGPATNSNSLKFSVTTLSAGTSLPAPVISSIFPSNAAAETLTGPPIALTVNGSSLSPCSVAQWNGNPLPVSIFIGTSGIASFLPAANLTSAGIDQVTVATPGASTSGSQTFTVFSPGTPSSTAITGAPLSLPLMSAGQRYGVYVLASTDGATEIPGSLQNIFVSDTCTGAPAGCTPTNAIVSIGSGATPANADSISPAISANSTDATVDGRYITFLSSATNLVAGGTNGVLHAFVRDTCAGTTSGCTPSTQLVSVATSGTQSNAPTTSATIDATGRYVTFESTATNLGATSPSGGIFVRDTCAGAPVGCIPSTQPLD
jgi:trimeric autotransporter adhesin